MPFLFLGGCFLLLAFFVAMVSLPKIMGNTKVNFGSFTKVLSDKRLLFGARGMFVYVGAEVSIGSFLVNYFIDLDLDSLVKEKAPLRSIVMFLSETFSGKKIEELDTKGIVGTFGLFYWGSAMIGRFVGAKLTSKMNTTAAIPDERRDNAVIVMAPNAKYIKIFPGATMLVSIAPTNLPIMAEPQ